MRNNYFIQLLLSIMVLLPTTIHAASQSSFTMNTVESMPRMYTCYYQAFVKTDAKGELQIHKKTNEAQYTDVSDKSTPSFPKQYAGILIMLVGVVLILAAVFNWDWAFEYNTLDKWNNRNLINFYWFQEAFGRFASRIALGIGGGIVSFCGWILYIALK